MFFFFFHNFQELTGNTDYNKQCWFGPLFEDIDFLLFSFVGYLKILLIFFSSMLYLEIVYKFPGLQLQNQSNEISLEGDVQSATPKVSWRLFYNLNLTLTHQSIL